MNIKIAVFRQFAITAFMSTKFSRHSKCKKAIRRKSSHINAHIKSLLGMRKMSKNRNAFAVLLNFKCKQELKCNFPLSRIFQTCILFLLAFHLCREIERNSFIVATAPSTMNSSNPWKMIFWMEQLGNFSCAWCCNHFHNALVATTAIPEIWDLPQVFFFIVLAIVSIVQFRFQISTCISFSEDNGFIV